ncbi:MAG: hypothetical protein DA328_09990 [Nitrososphaeraceae archaeon]|nr:hypothetical protein [Nitrososphaeraceae archaeon]
MDWIKAHIDLFNNELNMPIEMKTARMDSTQLQKYGGPSVTYLLQLAIYLILTKTNKGLLYYNLLAQKGGDFHHGYILNLSDDLKLKIEAFLKKLAEKYKNAIIQKNPYLIEGVHNDYNMNYICEYCPYANSSECVEGGIVRDKKIAWRKMKGSK